MGNKMFWKELIAGGSHAQCKFCNQLLCKRTYYEQLETTKVIHGHKSNDSYIEANGYCTDCTVIIKEDGNVEIQYEPLKG